MHCGYHLAKCESKLATRLAATKAPRVAGWAGWRAGGPPQAGPGAKRTKETESRCLTPAQKGELGAAGSCLFRVSFRSTWRSPRQPGLGGKGRPPACPSPGVGKYHVWALFRPCEPLPQKSPPWTPTALLLRDWDRASRESNRWLQQDFLFPSSNCRFPRRKTLVC